MSDKEQSALHIIRRLADSGFRAVFAGGCVRDRILGVEPKDFDIATDARPEVVQELFDRTVAVGAKFGVIGVLIGGWKQLRPSYIAYMALSILIPMSTSSLMSMPRFALVLFPMFAILARDGEKPWVNNLVVAFSLPLLGLFTVLFADWYWVA